jgi:hypothetical protein
LLIFEKIVIFGGHKCIAKDKLIVVVDSRHISEPRSPGEFIQQQFLGFCGIDFYFPHPHDSGIFRGPHDTYGSFKITGIISNGHIILSSCKRIQEILPKNIGNIRLFY